MLQWSKGHCHTGTWRSLLCNRRMAKWPPAVQERGRRDVSFSSTARSSPQPRGKISGSKWPWVLLSDRQREETLNPIGLMTETKHRVPPPHLQRLYCLGALWLSTWSCLHEGCSSQSPSAPFLSTRLWYETPPFQPGHKFQNWYRHMQVKSTELAAGDSRHCWQWHWFCEVKGGCARSQFFDPLRDKKHLYFFCVHPSLETDR